MDKKTDKLISDYISTVAEKNVNLISAYIFGSYAKRTNRPDSDIDVALIIDNLSDHEKFDLQVQLMLLASDFDYRIEPHPISQRDFISDNPFVSEIKRSGIEIKLRTKVA